MGTHLCYVVIKFLQERPRYKNTRRILANFDIWPLSVTLIFELPTWFERVTHRLNEKKNVC